MNKIPRLTRFLAVVVLVYVAAFSLLRLVFWHLFDNPNDPLGGNTLAHALYIGLKFDLRLALLMVLPIFALGWIRWLSPFGNRPARIFWNTYLTVATLAALLFYITDFGHFAYLHTRIDSNVLRFLTNPLISLEMVWESYPIVMWSVVIAVMVAVFAFGISRLSNRFAAAEHRPVRGWRKALLVTFTIFIFLFGIYGKVSWYPLRWSDAFFSTNAFASSVAANPVLYFYETYAHEGNPYNVDKVRKHYATVAQYLGVDHPDPTTLNFTRRVVPAEAPKKKYNVVLVIIESFAAYKTNVSGNPLNPTPNFERLARNGLYFKNFFTPHTGTARSVFATVTSIPDVTEGDTSSRNPTIVNQHTILSDFDGYEKYYFLGGSASWRNIRAMLANNIPGIHIYEEGSYTSPRNDVWGISDLNLFKEANKVLKAQKKPFFAIIQTAGDHRPYTIPEDNEGFQLRNVSQKELEKYGFESDKEFNSYRFMDHSIGHFMKLAKESGYLDNTIFVFYGDHGISGNAGIHTYKADSQLALGSYRVPFVIYSPKLFPKGKTIDKVASEVDVMPTLAGLTGQSYTDTTFGRDLFDPRYDKDRYAFIIAHSRRSGIGVVDKDFYFRMLTDGSNKGLYRIYSDDPRKNLIQQYPAMAAKMADLADGIYQTAKYVMNHNPRTFDKPGTTTPVAAK